MKPTTIEVKADFMGVSNYYNAIVDEHNIMDVVLHSDELTEDRDEILNRFMALVMLDSIKTTERHIEELFNGPKASNN